MHFGGLGTHFDEFSSHHQVGHLVHVISPDDLFPPLEPFVLRLIREKSPSILIPLRLIKMRLQF